MATGRWHTAQGAASVESGAHSRSAEHDNRPRCHASRFPHSTGADPREVDKSIQMSSYNSDELLGADVHPSLIRSYRRKVKINSVNLRSFVYVSSQSGVSVEGSDRVSKQGIQSVHRSIQRSEYMRKTTLLGHSQMSRKAVSNDYCRAKHDLERSLRTADLASGEEEEVRVTDEPEETHRSTCRRATRDSQSLSSPEYGRHNSCKRSEPWTVCQRCACRDH